MTDRLRFLGGIGLAVLVLVAGVRHRQDHAPTARVSAGTPRPLTAAQRAGRLGFDPSVAPYDRSAILTAIAHARPEARRLLDIVDGAVTVTVAPTPDKVAGETIPLPTGYEIVLNLGIVAQLGGQRAIDRVVLHELGHVVDFALVPPAMRARLVAEVPAGYGCEDGVTGACTAAAEVFADSFAKWATGDIGADLELPGYRIPPPSDLASWGRPLEALR